MKFFFFVYTLFVFASCQNTSTSKLSDHESFDENLLIGDWKRTNDSGAKKTYESWWLSKKGEPRGKGFTLLDLDTIWSEGISIKLIDGIRNLVVKDSENNEVEFKFISESKNSFKCHNPNNEFPNFIEYKISENNIIAVISGGENSIDFLFDRIKSRDLESRQF